MPTIDPTVAGPTANSYASMLEAIQYFDNRLPIVPAWVASGDAESRALITAARFIDAMAQPRRVYVPEMNGSGYFRIRSQWTGSPTTTTQRMAWPRIGMFDRNGNAIDSMTIPFDLKQAQCEFAGQLLAGDRTLDNDVAVQGISSIKAGSVAISFRDMVMPQVWPDAVWNLLVPSWLTEESIENASQSEFAVFSNSGDCR